MKTNRVAPKAAMLIESMRDIGYTLETALADVVDNSISARATKISLMVDSSDGAQKIGILDDGVGMTHKQLLIAMRPGSRNPLDAREDGDLGRFGLGLKTASFSQCRRLTVVTQRAGVRSAAIWDLKFVAKKDDWLIQIPPKNADIPWADLIGENGTLVVWQDLDRIMDPGASADSAAHFVQRVDEAREHLELVFHRYLAGEHGTDKVQILLNNRPFEPFNPFHSRHPATIAGPIETIKTGDDKVAVQCFTLPHHRKVPHADWEKYGGKGGYLKNQGFYVYRKKRLILHGTWFGLARQMELTKLARVRVDIPNGLDADWKIDVRKASAQPPHRVRERLRRIIEPIVATSKRVYTSRGRVLVTDSRLPVWNRIQDKNQITYAASAQSINARVCCIFISNCLESN